MQPLQGSRRRDDVAGDSPPNNLYIVIVDRWGDGTAIGSCDTWSRRTSRMVMSVRPGFLRFEIEVETLKARAVVHHSDLFTSIVVELLSALVAMLVVAAVASLASGVRCRGKVDFQTPSPYA